MKLAIGGVCANLLAIIGAYMNLADSGSEEAARIVALIAGIFWALSVLGLVLMAAGKRRAGGILTIIGAVVFVPLGLIAVIGARSAMAEDTQGPGGDQDMAERRRLADEGTPKS
ncbi:MAG: hypothetical protein LBF16_00270 [Pseudomonadales bacterium]|nr:hypothetical protein [Pseudomonadales bacterium]